MDASKGAFNRSALKPRPAEDSTSMDRDPGQSIVATTAISSIERQQLPTTAGLTFGPSSKTMAQTSTQSWMSNLYRRNQANQMISNTTENNNIHATQLRYKKRLLPQLQTSSSPEKEKQVTPQSTKADRNIRIFKPGEQDQIFSENDIKSLENLQLAY